MKKLHTHLMQKHAWYAKWHAHPHHSKVHIAALAVFIAILGFTSFGSSNAKTAAQTGIPAIDVASDTQLLKEGDFALLTEGGNKKNLVKAIVQIAGSGPMEVKVPKGATISVISYQEGQQTYVQKNAPNMQIKSVYDFDGFDASGKIDKAISRKLGKSETVSVVVVMKTSFKKFYDLKDAPTARSAKAQEFKTKKDSIDQSIRGNGKIKHDLQIINGLTMEVNGSALEGLKKNPNVAKVYLDRQVRMYTDTSVAQIKAPNVWSFVDSSGRALTGDGMKIAILDTGVDYTHPDLGGCFGPSCKVAGGWDFINNDADPMDDQGHGTHVAATAAGKGAILKGVAPDAKIYAYKVLSAGGFGDSGQIALAVQKATDPNGDGNPADHLDVASMSLGADCGSYSDWCGPNDYLATAVDNSTAAGVIHTIAAGNSGPALGTVGSPGVARTAITVAASCKTEQGCAITSFSSRGPVIFNGEDILKPDIAAPGLDICAARWQNAFSNRPSCFDSQHVRISGTSMATPHMAGVAALMRQAYPNYSVQQIKDRLKNTARNLGGGLTYNDQGAGEVDVVAAIPMVSEIASTPAVWSLSTNPTSKLTTTTQQFSVSALNNSVGTVSIDFSSTNPGITFTSSKSTLNLSNLATDAFSGTITVDNDVVKAGYYNATIKFMQNGVQRGALAIQITVSPTITASVSSLDYGVDAPTLSTWESQTIPVTYTNKRTDISQSISFSPQGFPSNVSFQATPSSLTIPPGGAATVSTKMSVTNSGLANGTYTGFLIASNAANEHKLSAKFVKYFVLDIEDTSGSTIAGGFVAMRNRTNNQQFSFSVGSNPFRLYFAAPMQLDAVMYYPYNGTDGYLIMKEGVSVGGTAITTLNIAKSQATNKIHVESTDINGNPTARGQSLMGFLSPSNGTTNMIPNYFGALRDFYMNNVSTSYLLSLVTFPANGSAPAVYLYGGERTGLSGDWSITSAPSQMKRVTNYWNTSQPAGSPILPVTVHCFTKNQINCYGFASPEAIAVNPYIQDIYSTYPAGYFVYQSGDVMGGGCPALPCAHAFQSAYLDLQRGFRKLQPYPESVSFPLPAKIYTGLGPTIFFSKLVNTTSAIKIYSALDSQIMPFLRQDISKPDTGSLPFTILKNGSPFASSFFGMGLDGITSFTLFNTVPAPAGSYQFKTSVDYKSAGKLMTGTTTMTFDTSRVDPNPPYIKGFRYFTNGVRSEAYGHGVENKLEVDLDANSGTLASVVIAYNADGGSFANATVTPSGTTYSAIIPALAATDKVTLKVVATDSAGNSSEYLFGMPLQTGGGGDTTPPIVSITSPANGDTVSGGVTIAANATDDVGIDHVDFFRTGVLIGGDATAPYTAEWNTTTLANGTYSLTAKAYDTFGRTTTSSAVSVTVNNAGGWTFCANEGETCNYSGTKEVRYGAQETYATLTLAGPISCSNETFGDPIPGVVKSCYYKSDSTGDTTPPAVVMTAPSNGATLSGAVTLSATASDNVGVTKVSFFRGTTLIDTDTTGSPGYAITWDTASVANGAYTLTAKAYDASNNVTTSSAVQVSVSNGTPPPPSDTTPPTVSITSPANGATISGVTSIAATASDNVGVDHVDFYRGTTLIGADASAPYSMSWDTTTMTNGAYSLTARAFDAAGNNTTSSAVAVTVDNGTTPPPPSDTTPPTVSITSPANGAIVGATVPITATASDNLAVLKVEFYRGTTLIDTDTTAGAGGVYAITWKPPKAKGKKYTLTAKAYDVAGNTKTSTPVEVTYN